MTFEVSEEVRKLERACALIEIVTTGLAFLAIAAVLAWHLV